MATRPNPSAGVSQGQIAEIQVTPAQRQERVQKFSFTVKSGEKTWYFALPPALESALQFGPDGPLKGSMEIPETLPGLLNLTNIKFKNFIVPGGSPAVQAIGIQSTTFKLVGMIIGTDGLTANPSVSPVYGGSADPINDTTNAANSAIKFDKEIVQPAKEVTIEIKADVVYKYVGVILTFKYYMRRSNCTYYSLEILATKYQDR